MKVLQINSYEGVGSTGRIASGIQQIVRENGHEFLNCYGRKSNKTKDSIKIGDNIDIYKHVIATRVFDRHGLASKKPTQNLIKQIISLNPDVIHLQNIHGYYLNYKILFKFLKEYKKPIVWSLHDCWSFTGHCSHFEYVDCNRFETGCFNCPEKSSYPKSIVWDNSKKNYLIKKETFTNVENLTIVTASDWLDRQLEKSFLKNYPREKIQTGIDLKKFRPIKSDIKTNLSLNNKFVILGVASVWGSRKGLGEFIKLSKVIKEDEIIVLVGVNEKEKSNLPKNIIGVSKTESIEELAKIYSMADVFANPTLEDTFPTTNLEAQACGTPVITYNTGGSPESVPEGCGYTVDKSNISSLYEKISDIKTNSKQKYFSHCLENARKYDMYIKYQDYYLLYQKLLGGIK
ncbi:glycosyltransferase [Macrococcus epidermidis]|uniref:glycosyltransferase n=1 Tax=Macrococcus epidermidis TaxID=1902580 RepID=UPI001EF2EDEA|nr:glycosyltransferase [Macrococcus epidermidis]MCG7421118.1 glycosyltransferase [Macrococcus epidermidis]